MSGHLYFFMTSSNDFCNSFEFEQSNFSNLIAFVFLKALFISRFITFAPDSNNAFETSLPIKPDPPTINAILFLLRNGRGPLGPGPWAQK